MGALSSVTPKLVQSIFEMYASNKLIVNRRYQRKLVWNIGEKQKFIDSLLNGFPIPLILTSKLKGNEEWLEILDGLQRLNAITSFIECEYSVNGKYFDLDATAMTKKMKESGHLEQKEPRMELDECSRILNYEVPFLTTSYTDNSFIDETFRRINTGGRRLSLHDVRQAGSIGSVPDIINNIAIYIRRDSSRTDTVTLNNMKSISIGDDSLNYGININEIFWVKNNIINHENIRCSRDEELIAYIVSYILLPKESHTTSAYLDKIYDSESVESNKLQSEITKLTPDYIVKTITHTYDELNTIFKDVRSNFSDTVFDGRPNKIAQCFQVVFIALYELLINDNMIIVNHRNIHSALKKIYNNHMSAILNSDKKWRNEDRRNLILSIKGILSPHLQNAKTKRFELGGWIKNLENIINESQTEQQYYDYKAGLVTTSPLNNDINENTLSKIIKTLTAMTNSCQGECMVIVGIAESEEGAKNHQIAFGRSYVKYSNMFIVGIDEEAKHTLGSVDKYLLKVKQLVENKEKNKISPEFMTKILNGMVSFSYKEKEILIFRTERGGNPEAYDGRFYTRQLSHLNEVKIPSADLNNLYANFSQK